MAADTKEDKGADEVNFYVYDKKKKKQVFLQPTINAVDFGFPGMCVKQQDFLDLKYVKHVAPGSPYHVWELSWKAPADGSKKKGGVMKLEIETTNEGYHQIQDRIDLWSVKAESRSREPSPEPQRPQTSGGRSVGSRSIGSRSATDEKTSALYQAINARADRSRSPAPNRGDRPRSPYTSPLKERPSIQSLPARTQSDASGRRSMDAIARALANPNADDLDEVREEEEEKGELANWLEKNIGGPSVLAAIRSRSPSPLPRRPGSETGDKDETMFPRSRLTEASDLGQKVKGRSRSDLGGMRSHAAIARAMADPDEIEEEEEPQHFETRSRGRSSHRATGPKYVEEEAPYYPKQRPPSPLHETRPHRRSQKGFSSGDSFTSSGDETAAFYASKARSSHKHSPHGEDRSCRPRTPHWNGEVVPRSPRDEQHRPLVRNSSGEHSSTQRSRSGRSLAESDLDGRSEQGGLQRTKSGMDGKDGGLQRTRSRHSAHDQEYDQRDFDNRELRGHRSSKLNLRPSGEEDYYERDLRRTQSHVPADNDRVARMMASFAKEREEWRSSMANAVDELRGLKVKDRGVPGRHRDREPRQTDYPKYSSGRSGGAPEVPEWLRHVYASRGPQLAVEAAHQAGIRVPEAWLDRVRSYSRYEQEAGRLRR